MDRIMKVFCGEEVSCIEDWAEKKKLSHTLISRIYQSLIEPGQAYQHVEFIFDQFDKEAEDIQNKIRMALVRVQMFAQYHMFEKSEFRDAGDIAVSLERMLFGYNLTEGKKPSDEESEKE